MTKPPKTHFDNGAATACGKDPATFVATTDHKAVTRKQCQLSPFFIRSRPQTMTPATGRAPGVPVGIRIDGMSHKGARYW